MVSCSAELDHGSVVRNLASLVAAGMTSAALVDPRTWEPAKPAETDNAGKDFTSMEIRLATAGRCGVITSASPWPAVTGQATAKSSVAANTNFLAQFVGATSRTALAVLAECCNGVVLVDLAGTAPMATFRYSEPRFRSSSTSRTKSPSMVLSFRAQPNDKALKQMLLMLRGMPSLKPAIMARARFVKRGC